MGARILIVEDEEPLALLLRYNLEAEGYEVETVARGDEADIRLREAPPDLAVLDWMLPGISGIELCRRLRARHWWVLRVTCLRNRFATSQLTSARTSFRSELSCTNC